MTNNDTKKVKIPAKKSLGQNWLVNQGVLDRIVAAANITASDTVLEVGPGTGALTQRLVATGARIVAVEKDRRLIELLREKFSDNPNVQVVEGDILALEPSAYQLEPGLYKLVANLPYYLTSHLIRLMLEQWPAPSHAVLMVQEEVADRMLAVPPDMNLLALSVQFFSTPSMVMRVSRGSFRPIPSVDSAVIKLEIQVLSNELREQNRQILEIAKKAFGQKRKQLTATIALPVLERAGILPTMRPQELAIDQWRAIASAAEDMHTER